MDQQWVKISWIVSPLLITFWPISNHMDPFLIHFWPISLIIWTHLGSFWPIFTHSIIYFPEILIIITKTINGSGISNQSFSCISQTSFTTVVYFVLVSICLGYQYTFYTILLFEDLLNAKVKQSATITLWFSKSDCDIYNIYTEFKKGILSYVNIMQPIHSKYLHPL